MVSRTVSLAPASVFLAFLAMCPLPPSLSADSSSPPDALFPNEKALVSAAYAAIEHIHAQMDDDNSGGVDLAESRDFIQEELSQVTNSNLMADSLCTRNVVWRKRLSSATSISSVSLNVRTYGQCSPLNDDSYRYYYTVWNNQVLLHCLE